MGMKKMFFNERVVGYWKSLPKEVVMVLSLVKYKQHLDNTLRHVL